MKKGIMILALLQMVVGVQAVVYKLERVNKIVSGEKYVLVHKANNRALNGVISNGKLQSTDSYLTENLTGDESYVWEIKKSGDYYRLNNGTNCLCKVYSSENNLEFIAIESSVTKTDWKLVVNADSTLHIKTTDETKWLGRNTTADTDYKIYSNVNAASLFIYHLVAETYEREVTVGVLGTICLPYAVDKVEGADVYQLTCKESDGSGNPNNVYYELVEMPLVAGHPYLFEPTASSVVFHRKDVETVSGPVYNSDGFYGTFTDITDGTVLAGKYMLNSQNQFQLCGSNCGLRANRGYFNLSETPEKQAGQVAQRRMLIVGQNGVDHIEPHNIGTRIDDVNVNANVNKVMVGGQLMIIHEGNYYNAQGGRL